ncbi:MAG: hypothetical protein BWY63_01185 [Chloroflexi bacterium ADurb.Bin360]|nr:MAG: hypothetical protein BWY63_01185 [Chloroflexi bacterium ADurb.Bin360]
MTAGEVFTVVVESVTVAALLEVDSTVATVAATVEQPTRLRINNPVNRYAIIFFMCILLLIALRVL